SQTITEFFGLGVFGGNAALHVAYVKRATTTSQILVGFFLFTEGCKINNFALDRALGRLVEFHGNTCFHHQNNNSLKQQQQQQQSRERERFDSVRSYD